LKPRRCALCGALLEPPAIYLTLPLPGHPTVGWCAHATLFERVPCDRRDFFGLKLRKLAQAYDVEGMREVLTLIQSGGAQMVAATWQYHGKVPLGKHRCLGTCISRGRRGRRCETLSNKQGGCRWHRKA
jgi:hypothetical protein